jgi:hypothetical protein
VGWTLERTEQVHVDITTMFIIRLLTPQYTTQMRSAASSLTFSTLHRAPTGCGCEESTFRSRFGSTTLSRKTLNLRKTERLTGGEDHVGFVRAEPALGVDTALRVVWRKSSWAGRRIDESRCPLGRAGWLNEVGGVNRSRTTSVCAFVLCR